MYKPNGLDRKSLQIQLENYKLITELSPELLDEFQFAKGELPGKLELAQIYLNQSRECEESGDKPQPYDALASANILIVEVGAMLKLLLHQNIPSNMDNLHLDQS